MKRQAFIVVLVLLALIGGLMIVGSSPPRMVADDLPGCPTLSIPPTMSCVELHSLYREVNGISSRYVVTNQGSYTATTLHEFRDLTGTTVNVYNAILSQAEGRLFDLRTTDGLTRGYTGYALIVSDVPITASVLPPVYSIYLPSVVKSPPGVQCYREGSVELCAWVSNQYPIQHSDVTVFGQFKVNDVAQAGQAMATMWHYKTVDSMCPGMTRLDGIAQCTRNISAATPRYIVTIEVSIGGYIVATGFTPQ